MLIYHEKWNQILKKFDEKNVYIWMLKKTFPKTIKVCAKRAMWCVVSFYSWNTQQICCCSGRVIPAETSDLPNSKSSILHLICFNKNCHHFVHSIPLFTFIIIDFYNIWRPSSLSRLTHIIFYMEFTDLGSKAYIYC